MNYTKQIVDEAFDMLIQTGGNRFLAINRLISEKGLEKEESIAAVGDAYRRIDSYNPKAEIRFGDFVDLWFKEYARPNLKRTSYRSNELSVNKNFQGLLDLQLCDINRDIVQNWVFELTEKGLSAKTVKNNFAILHKILDRAFRWKYINSNPATSIDLPHVVKKEAGYYNNEEVMQLLYVLEKVPPKDQLYKVAILLALFGGMRRGEICGVDIDDIDFAKNTINIRQTRQGCGENGGIYVDTPKTAKSVRIVTLPDRVMEEILLLIKMQQQEAILLKDKWNNSKALIKNHFGAPLYPHSLNRWLRKLEQDNGLPELSLHGLRHTHTSMLIDSGENIERISRRLGHSETTTTLNIYSHVYHESEVELVNKLNDLYFS